MRRKMKYIMICILSMLLIFGMAPLAFAEDVSPKVMIDGKYLSFSDAAPQNINGRVMIPFRAILESMGAEVAYDEESKNISASRNGTKIVFKAGSSELLVINGDASYTKTTDTASFIDSKTQRTMVPVRFMAEAFDLAISWDAATKTVVIIDFDKLFAQDDEHKIMKLLSEADRVSSENMEITGTLAGSTAVSGKEATHFEGTMSGILSPNTIEIEASLEEEADTGIKINIDTGRTYIKDTTSALTGDTNYPDAWKTINLNKSFEEKGIQFMDILIADINSFHLEALAISKYYTEDFTVDTYNNMAQVYEMLSDSNFTMQEKARQKIYTAEYEIGNQKGELTIVESANALVSFEMNTIITSDTCTVKISSTGFSLKNYATEYDISTKDINTNINMTIRLKSTQEVADSSLSSGSTYIELTTF